MLTNSEKRAFNRFLDKKDESLSPLEPPEIITEKMMSLVRKVSDSEPVKLFSTNEGHIKACYLNAQKKVKQYGGRIVCGWMIYNWWGLGVELIPHGIWEQPDGQWIDLTPEQDGYDFVWFVEDRDWEWVLGMSSPTLDLYYPGALTSSEYKAWLKTASEICIGSRREFLQLCKAHREIYDAAIEREPFLKEAEPPMRFIHWKMALSYPKRSKSEKAAFIDQYLEDLKRAA